MKCPHCSAVVRASDITKTSIRCYKCGYVEMKQSIKVKPSESGQSKGANKTSFV